MLYFCRSEIFILCHFHFSFPLPNLCVDSLVWIMCCLVKDYDRNCSPQPKATEFSEKSKKMQVYWVNSCDFLQLMNVIAFISLSAKFLNFHIVSNSHANNATHQLTIEAPIDELLIFSSHLSSLLSLSVYWH